MIYGKIPMLIFILASGYLLTVYLLLALAKRTGNKVTQSRKLERLEKHHSNLSVTTKVTGATSLR